MNPKCAKYKKLLPALLTAFLFAGAYGQWPLYSGTQNTYFLHGTAQAEKGALQYDWMANTTDPFPFFSAYVSIVLKYFSSDVFYAIHAIFILVYMLCLIKLAVRVLAVPLTSEILAISVTVLTLIHSDFVHMALQKTGLPFSQILTAFFMKGAAQETLLPHYQQPGASAIFLLVSIYSFLKGRRISAVIAVSLLVWFHPANFMYAGVLILSYMLIEYREGKKIRAIKIGFLAFIIALPSLLYTWVNFAPSSSETALRANHILVHERFPHHANPRIWFGRVSLLQILVVIGGLFIFRKERKLFTILTTLFLFSCAVILLQVVTSSCTLAMLRPARIFCLLVPISSVFLLMASIKTVSMRIHWIAAHKRFVIFICNVLMAVFFLVGIGTTFWRIEHREFPIALCQFVSRNCSTQDTYLIPPDLDWFRLAAKCPIFVDWKSHPYQADELVEWYERVQLAKAFYRAKTPGEISSVLASIQRYEPITHLLVKRGQKPLLEAVENEPIFHDTEYILVKLTGNERTGQSRQKERL